MGKPNKAQLLSKMAKEAHQKGQKIIFQFNGFRLEAAGIKFTGKELVINLKPKRQYGKCQDCGKSGYLYFFKCKECSKKHDGQVAIDADNRRNDPEAESIRRKY